MTDARGIQVSQTANRKMFAIEKRALGIPVSGSSLAEGMLGRIEDSLARIEAQLEGMDGRLDGMPTASALASLPTTAPEIVEAPTIPEPIMRSADGEITREEALMVLGIDEDLLVTAVALQAEEEAVRTEVAAMVRIVGQVRQEIATIAPIDDRDEVADATAELDAVVQATEEATNRILAAVENAEENLKVLEGRVEDEADRVLLDKIGGEMVEILEASTFQDLTGQRIRKVVGTLDQVRLRVLNLVNILGASSLVGLSVDVADEEDEEAGLLEGPQMDGAGLSQDEIDKLFD